MSQRGTEGALFKVALLLPLPPKNFTQHETAPFLIVLLKAFRNELRYLQLFSIFRDHKVAIDYCNGVIGLKNALLRH